MNKRVLFSAALLALFSGSTAFAQGGLPWTEGNLGANAAALGVTDFDMPSQNVIWGVNYDGSGAMPAVPTQDMFLSTDGGVTWQVNSIATTNSAIMSAANISAIDGSTAFVSMYDADGMGATNGLLVKTTDGGTTWSEVTSLPGVPFLNIVHFFNANEGLVMSDPDAAGYVIYRTTDGGTTWTRVPAASVPAPVAGDYGLVNQFAAIGDNIWFTTLKGRIYHSTDKGVTWMSHTTGFVNAGNTAAVRHVEFSDANNGLMAGRVAGTLRRTTDGGATWAPVTLPVGTDFFVASLARIPGTPGAYVSTGADPTVGVGSSVTYDNGTTWTELDTLEQRTAVIFFDADHGWAGQFSQAGGVGGVLQYTGDPLLATRNDLVREAAAAYPNPTTGVLRLAGADPRETVTVYDQAGRVTLRQSVGTTTTLDLSNQPVGLYQLVFTGGKVARTTRVAVTR